MKTNFKKIRLCPLHRNVLTRQVDRLMRDFESLDAKRRRAYIAEARDAATSLCASAFRTAVTATPDGGAPGVDPEIALRDLVAEVRDIEVSLQDLAPSVALAERVENKLRELFTTDLRQPSGKGGRPVQKHLDVEAIRRARGQTSKSVFARLCGISVKTLDRALAGNTVSKATCDGIDKYLKTLRKNTPQKRQ
jgi:hypothetical protein